MTKTFKVRDLFNGTGGKTVTTVETIMTLVKS